MCAWEKQDGSGMKVLFLSWWWPNPPDNGSKLRVYHLLRQLARRHEVTLLAFAEPGEATPERVAALEGFCARVHHAPKVRFAPGRLRALAGFFHPWPRWLVDVYSDDMNRLVQAEARAGGYDLVIASQTPTTPYALPLKGVKRLFEEVEVAVLRDQFEKQASALKRARYGLTWLKLVQYVRRARQAFDGCTVASPVEAENVARAAPGDRPLAVIPNGVDTAAYARDYGPPQPDTLIYPGALSYFANYDAAAWFAGEILPLVAAARPAVQLRITGSTQGVNLNGFPRRPQVRFTGYLDDITPTLAQSWACVTPLRVGGGTRLKILEAMACGVPVVSTTKGAEGLDVTPGRDILIADTPAAFAEAVLCLLGDAALRASLAAAGRHLVESQYDWSKVGDRLLRFVDAICRESGTPAQVQR